MNKPTTMNESANMQLQYQRVVCVPFPELVDAPYNKDKHSTFSGKDKDDAQSTKSKAQVVGSKTTQDYKNKKEKEAYNCTTNFLKWEEDSAPLPLPRRHSFFDFEATRSNKLNVIRNSPSFCSIGRHSSLQAFDTTNESEEGSNAIDDFLYVMLLRR